MRSVSQSADTKVRTFGSWSHRRNSRRKRRCCNSLSFCSLINCTANSETIRLLSHAESHGPSFYAGPHPFSHEGSIQQNLCTACSHGAGTEKRSAFSWALTENEPHDGGVDSQKKTHLASQSTESAAAGSNHQDKRMSLLSRVQTLICPTLKPNTNSFMLIHFFTLLRSNFTKASAENPGAALQLQLRPKNCSVWHAASTCQRWPSEISAAHSLGTR